MESTLYTPNWIADFFHGFPHINFSFQNSNSTFDPSSPSYRESLVFLVALPLLLCVVLLLFTSCCLCVHCIKKRPQKAAKTCCLQASIYIFVILSLGALGVSFYGNESANKGVQCLVDALQDTDDTLNDAFSTLDNLDKLADNITNRGIKTVNNVFNQYLINITIRDSILKLTQQIQGESENARKDIASIKNNTPNVKLQSISAETVTIEFYRWTGTVVMLCFVIFMFIIAFVGVCKKSKCLLIFAVSLGFFCLILIWASAGVYLGAAVAGGDLCVNPEYFLEHMTDNKLRNDVIKSYIDCNPQTGGQTQFSESIKKAFNSVTLANRTLNTVVNMSLPFHIEALVSPVAYLRLELNYAFDNITNLNELLQCRRTHDNFMKSVNGICKNSMTGISLLLLMLLVIGVCMTMSQCLLPRFWLLSSKRKGYRPVDDTDPFCPRPPPYNGYGTISGTGPSTSRNLEGSVFMTSLNDETYPMRGPLTDSPPPAYRPRNFTDEYNDFSRPTSMASDS